MKRHDPDYRTFESHIVDLSEHYTLDYLESRSLFIDRPRYMNQQSLWTAYAYLLKSKIEQKYFDEKVLILAEGRKVFEFSTQKLLMPVYWQQVIDLKNFGTLDEGPTLYGTIYLKRIRDLRDPVTEIKIKTGIKLFDRLYKEMEFYIMEELSINKLKDARTKNREIEERMKEKFPELSLIFIRELVSYMRKDLR